MGVTTGGLITWPRGRLTDFVRRHELSWDLVMGVLTIGYVALAFSEDSPLGPQTYAVWGLSVIFLIEFSVRCFDALNRRAYLRSHWLDLVTAVPVPGIPGLRLVRLLRLLRFAKIGVLLRRGLIGRGWGETGLIWPTLILFWIGSALALWLVEHDAAGSTITTFPDAMTGAFLAAATLGFGRHFLPVTQDGQIIAAIIVFFALGLWGFASSNLTRMWLHAQQELPSAQLDGLSRDVQAVREQVDRLAVALLERAPREHRGDSPSLLPSTGADEASVLGAPMEVAVRQSLE
jgi:voltage-gated potassium channel